MANLGASCDRAPQRIPCGAVCRFCKRKDTDPNPLTYLLHVCSTLQWRRKHGLVCNICPYFIENDEEYCTKDSDKLCERLENPEEQGKYNTKLVSYISNNNETNGNRAAPNKAKKTDVAVTAYSSDKVQYQKVCGNVWPLWLYKKEKGVAPPRRLVQTHNINGQRVRGVLMNPADGAPVGCFILPGISEYGISRETDVAKSSGDMDGKELDNVFENAHKKSRISTTLVKRKDADGNEHTTLRARFKDDLASNDSENDDAILASVWGKRVSSSSRQDLDDAEDSERRSMASTTADKAKRPGPKKPRVAVEASASSGPPDCSDVVAGNGRGRGRAEKSANHAVSPKPDKVQAKARNKNTHTGN